MIKKLLKAAFDEPERKAVDEVRNQNVQARFWVNQSRTGKWYLNFSLHCFARIKGESRWVNSFQPDDVEALPGLARKIASWLAMDRSMPLEQRTRLNRFAVIQEYLELLQGRFGDGTLELMQVLVHLTRDSKDVMPLLNSLRKLQEGPPPSPTKRPSTKGPRRSPAADGDDAIRLMEQLLEVLMERHKVEKRPALSRALPEGTAREGAPSKPRPTQLNGG